MKAFPFTDAEWAAVGDAARRVVNAELAGDAVLRASHQIGLFEVLAGLRARYADHPVLLETEADFTTDDTERVALYRRAADVAAAHGLRTLGIRLTLARVLLDGGSRGAARAELLACARERGAGDESEREAWTDLMTACGPPAV